MTLGLPRYELQCLKEFRHMRFPCVPGQSFFSHVPAQKIPPGGAIHGEPNRTHQIVRICRLRGHGKLSLCPVAFMFRQSIRFQAVPEDFADTVSQIRRPVWSSP